MANPLPSGADASGALSLGDVTCTTRRRWLRAVLCVGVLVATPFAYVATVGAANFADPSTMTSISHHYTLDQMREFAFKNSISTDYKGAYYTRWNLAYNRILEDVENRYRGISLSYLGCVRFDVKADDVIVFLHMQKTAGTSFERFLVRHLAIEGTCVCQMGKKRCSCLRPQSSNRIWLFSRYSTGWVCGLHADFTELSVSGCVDHSLDKKEGVHRKRRYFYTTFLREPVARFISEYRHVERGATWLASRHMCNGKPPTPEQLPMCFDPEQGWDGVSLDEFLACPYNLAFNRQTRMLADLTLVNCYDRRGMDAATRDRVMLDSAKANLKNFAFFGIKERMFDSQWIFEQVFQLRFTRRLDDWTRSKSNGTTVTDAQLSLIRSRNHLDVQLYEYALKLFSRRLRALRGGGSISGDGPIATAGQSSSTSRRARAEASRRRLARLDGEQAVDVDNAQDQGKGDEYDDEDSLDRDFLP